MTKIGYAAMLEQFHPTELLDLCARAEAAGFSAGFMVSEHFHPWTPQQGQSAFAWSFMGALGQRTSLPFGTAVTCPGFRYHPAVVAHAAATLGAMYPGRFWLGLGAGEALNEHVVGGEWPEIGVRSSMMFEAIEIINRLFGGEVVRHRGEHFRLESARLYTRPDDAGEGLRRDGRAGQREANRPAGRRADHGRGGRREDRHALGALRRGRPRGRQGPDGHAQAAPDPRQLGRRPTQEAMDNALREWPNGGMPFPKQDIRNPEDFAAMARLVRPEDFQNRCLISSDLAWHAEPAPALRRHGLRRDPPPQRRAQPGRVHRRVRARRPARAAPPLSPSPAPAARSLPAASSGRKGPGASCPRLFGAGCGWVWESCPGGVRIVRFTERDRPAVTAGKAID